MGFQLGFPANYYLTLALAFLSYCDLARSRWRLDKKMSLKVACAELRQQDSRRCGIAVLPMAFRPDADS